MQFDRGYLSPYFINNAEKQMSVLDILRASVRQESPTSHLLPLLEQVAKGTGAAAARHREEWKPKLLRPSWSTTCAES